MKEDELIRCRMVACREDRADDNDVWSFYLINDSLASLNWAALRSITWGWDERGPGSIGTLGEIGPLAPGTAALLWRNNGEVRMKLDVAVCLGCREMRLSFEFETLSWRRDLPMVDVLGKPGFDARQL